MWTISSKSKLITYQVLARHSQRQIALLGRPVLIDLIKISIQLKLDATARTPIIADTVPVR